jgi:outer membrane murein-binding lipoprotein Lpp
MNIWGAITTLGVGYLTVTALKEYYFGGGADGHDVDDLFTRVNQLADKVDVLSLKLSEASDDLNHRDLLDNLVTIQSRVDSLQKDFDKAAKKVEGGFKNVDKGFGDTGKQHEVLLESINTISQQVGILHGKVVRSQHELEEEPAEEKDDKKPAAKKTGAKK